jgi:hypothetical protein
LREVRGLHDPETAAEIPLWEFAGNSADSMRPTNLGLAGSSQSGHSTGPDQVVSIKCRAFLKLARTRRKGAKSR